MSKIVAIRITQDQLALIAYALGKVDYSEVDDFSIRESFQRGSTAYEELDALNQMCMELSVDPAPDTSDMHYFCM